MPTVHWEPDPYVIKYHLSCLERFDLQKKLKKLWKFLCFLLVLWLLSGACRRLESSDSRARMRQTMGIIMIYRYIKKIQAQLFCRRESIVYPSFKFIQEELLILSGRPAEANSCSLLDSDSEEHIMISCSWLTQWSFLIKILNVLVAEVRMISIIITLQIRASW